MKTALICSCVTDNKRTLLINIFANSRRDCGSEGEREREAEGDLTHFLILVFSFSHSNTDRQTEDDRNVNHGVCN